MFNFLLLVICSQYVPDNFLCNLKLNKIIIECVYHQKQRIKKHQYHEKERYLLSYPYQTYQNIQTVLLVCIHHIMTNFLLIFLNKQTNNKKALVSDY